MFAEGWRIEAEIAAGDAWACVATRMPTDRIERTHEVSFATLGMWLSPPQAASQARFLTAHAPAGFSRLGDVVAVPPDTPIQVVSGPQPPRRMVHCRLPSHQAIEFEPSGAGLAACLDLRSPELIAALSRLARETAEPGFASVAVVEALALLLATELARQMHGAAGDGARPRGGLAPWQLRRIDDYLRAGNWDCSVSELAQLCGISTGHAMRAFRQSTGQTLAAHIAEARLFRARTLLAEQGRSISEIARELKFTHPSSFTAAFRRSMGLTPRQYRQRMDRC